MNENGVVTDRRILCQGGRIPNALLDDVMTILEKIMNNNLIDAIVMNSALQMQTKIIRERLDRRLNENVVGIEMNKRYLS